MRACKYNGSVAYSVCAVRRCGSSGGERPSPAGLSQQVAVAEGSLIRVAAGRAGAALTKPGRAQYCQMGRVRRAWRKGVREEPAFYVLHL